MTVCKLISGLIVCATLSFALADAANAGRIVQPVTGHCIKSVDCCVPGRPCWVK